MRKAFIAAVLILPACLPAESPATYSQAIQLERGWNLVSWYLLPEDPTPSTDLTMDDLFDQQTAPGAPDDWFWSEFSTDPTDKVGRYDKSPHILHFYPRYGKDNAANPWVWNLRQAYAIYLDSPAHFWEFASRPEYNPPNPSPDPEDDDFTPNSAWDDFEQASLPATPQTTYWFFISYPLRKQIKLEDSQTIAWLRNYTDNPLAIIKDDEGHCYIPSRPERTTLEYLKPGKGYYLGFNSADEVIDCPWFFNEGSVPEYVPLSPKDNQAMTSSARHFTFKDRTHWWYPIEIDTIVVDGLSPEVGDEIAVFNNELCVGAQVFDGTYPIYLAAWMDDIATPNRLDGYVVNNEMIFKWYDASENQEITFEPPPQTQTVEADPYFPTHSGFGMGFCAVRSLVGGVQSVKQLPKEYSLAQNFPNPFNPTTVFPLELPQRSRVTIDIFDVSGRRVWTIEAGVRNAGRANVHFNASCLASGMYFYRVAAEGLERGGTYQDVGKMLLLK